MLPKLLWRIIRDALWALVLVFIFRGILMHFGLRARYDHEIHFAGGMAMAYFLYRACEIFAPYIGNLALGTRLFLTFTTSCTVALFWEFGEYASDIFRETHIQYSASETLNDLIAGSSGALLTVLILALVAGIRRKSSSSTHDIRGRDA